MWPKHLKHLSAQPKLVFSNPKYKQRREKQMFKLVTGRKQSYHSIIPGKNYLFGVKGLLVLRANHPLRSLHFRHQSQLHVIHTRSSSPLQSRSTELFNWNRMKIGSIIEDWQRLQNCLTRVLYVSEENFLEITGIFIQCLNCKTCRVQKFGILCNCTMDTRQLAIQHW